MGSELAFGKRRRSAALFGLFLDCAWTIFRRDVVGEDVRLAALPSGPLDTSDFAGGALDTEGWFVLLSPSPSRVASFLFRRRPFPRVSRCRIRCLGKEML